METPYGPEGVPFNHLRVPRSPDRPLYETTWNRFYYCQGLTLAFQECLPGQDVWPIGSPAGYAIEKRKAPCPSAEGCESVVLKQSLLRAARNHN